MNITEVIKIFEFSPDPDVSLTETDSVGDDVVYYGWTDDSGATTSQAKWNIVKGVTSGNLTTLIHITPAGQEGIWDSRADTEYQAEQALEEDAEDVPRVVQVSAHLPYPPVEE